VQEARNEGLANLYKTLSVTNQTQRMSLDYILTLTDKNTNLFVDFGASNVVVGGTGSVSQ
jgi:hypothetical protein